MKVLHARRGPLQGNAYQVGARTLIGRDPECDIQLVDREASRKHACVLEQDDGSILLRDLASQNGTRVGGESVREALLSIGDEVEIGDTCFELREVDEALARTQEIDMKLISGSAQAVTVAATLSEEDRAGIMAVLQERRAAAERAREGKGCCDSPLAERARQEGWPHCPACGGAPGSLQKP
ncbi:MAG: FHA domain-containing protein [Myxococcales bacterium]|nr:FHA domain-containing protein [Myxococcales bacterium]